MDLIRKTWADEFRDMNRLMQRMFSPMERATVGEELAMFDWSPAVDIEEKEDSYMILAELPNMEKKDVHITIENDILTIAGERKHEHEEKGRRYHRIERNYGRFCRSFRLPESVDDGHVDATFDKGLLTITLPKTHEARKMAVEVPVH